MKLLPTLRAALASTALALALPASAAFYIDDTTGGPTFNRATEGFVDVSPVGTAVAYDIYSFSVSLDGLYTVRSFAAGLFADDPWDQFLFLYADGFDPSAPLANGVISNDDLNGRIGASGFDVALSSGVAYFLVTTSFYNEDSGGFLNVIRGPGEILPAIPEPGTYAMLALGLLGVAFSVRRRTQDELG